jgi:miniconductance mechanosensitive channel
LYDQGYILVVGLSRKMLTDMVDDRLYPLLLFCHYSCGRGGAPVPNTSQQESVKPCFNIRLLLTFHTQAQALILARDINSESEVIRVFELVRNWLESQGLQGLFLEYLSWAVVAVGVIILAVITTFVTKRILLTLLSFLIRKTKTRWDDALLERRVLHRLSHLAPALVFYWFAGVFPGVESLIHNLAVIYMLIVSGLVVSSFLNAVVDIYRTMEISRTRPIKGFVQLFQILIIVLLAIFGLAVVTNQSPLVLLSGLGALTAVLLLVFKDSILGLVASFQISANNMVRIGDWIEMPKYGADGDVIDVSLHTIKVQNWNKTISTIPTYALISDTFKNWRGMEESGGRRIKRAVNIDINSISFCSEEMIERFSKYQYITEYINRKKDELARHNQEHKVDTNFLVNGRHMTNIGTFRAYVEAYLKNHPKIHQQMTFLVRQLPPGEHGQPIEIYVFSNDLRWAPYEAIQADIFDHILAVVPMFDLRVFQSPTGHDFRKLAGDRV